MSKKKVPQTSLDAKKSLDPARLAEIYKKILDALRIIGKGHYEDIARQMKVDPSRVWKRLSETHIMGLIERTGERKALSSGRDGFVWRLTNKDIPANPIVEKYLPGPTVSDYSKKLIQQPTLF